LGSFAYAGVGSIYHIQETLTANKYKYILQRQMMSSFNKLVNCHDGYFQHDNDPKHASKLCGRYLSNKKIQLLEWPSQSPDLNPIENLWKYLDDLCMERECKNELELFRTLKNAWNNIHRKYLRILVESMPRRCQAVLDAHGGATKY
jgi:hypothetical protein